MDTSSKISFALLKDSLYALATLLTFAAWGVLLALGM